MPRDAEDFEYAKCCLTESFPSQAPLSVPLNPGFVLKRGVSTHFNLWATLLTHFNSSATVMSVILDRKGTITWDDVYHYVFDSAHSRSEHLEL